MTETESEGKPVDDIERLTDEQLGEIMLRHFSPEQIRSGYRIDPADTAEIGRQARMWGDINSDGTLN